jgi:hypothetical protein
VTLIRTLIIHIVLWACLIGVTFAQQTKHESGKPGHLFGYDSGYVLSFRDNFVVTLLYEYKFSIAHLKYAQLSEIPVVYRSKPLHTAGIGLDYKWATIEFSQAIFRQTSGNISKNTGVGFGLTGRKLALRCFIDNYSGYVLESAPNASINQNKDGVFRNDLSSSFLFVSLNYNFSNKRFSNIASLWQLERQLKPSIGFMMGFNLVRNFLKADSAIIPINLQPNDALNRVNLGVSSIGLDIGAASTIPLSNNKKWYFTAAVIPGIALQQRTTNDQSFEKATKSLFFGLQSEFRIGFGFNGDLWYSGFSVRNYGTYNNIFGSLPFSVNSVYGRFFLGYRLPEIKSTKKWVKRLGF